jgi:hypothetical protein
MAGPLFGRANLYITRNGTARRIGVLQDLSLNVDFDPKLLYGQNSIAISAAIANGKIEGKSKFAEFDANVIRDLSLARLDSGSVTKTLVVSEDMQNTVPGTPFEIAVASLTSDLGVFSVTTGEWLKAVTGAPAAATEYQVTTGLSGKYTFHSGAAAAVVKLNYVKSHSTENGATQLVNSAMSAPLYFKMVAHRKFDNQAATVVLNKCFSPKLNLLSIKDDYSMPEFDFSAIDDPVNGIGIFSFGSASL